MWHVIPQKGQARFAEIRAEPVNPRVSRIPRTSTLFAETLRWTTPMACLLNETADLMEIDGADSFRIRSYRNAAVALEQTTVDLVVASVDTAQLLAIPGIGKSMAANIQAIAATGTMPLREELLTKYGAGLLELLKLPSMGPKTVALLWDAGKI